MKRFNVNGIGPGIGLSDKDKPIAIAVNKCLAEFNEAGIVDCGVAYHANNGFTLKVKFDTRYAAMAFATLARIELETLNKFPVKVRRVGMYQVNIRK